MEPIKRRKVIGGAGGLVVAGLAGCAGSESGDGGNVSPPELDFELSGVNLYFAYLVQSHEFLNGDREDPPDPVEVPEDMPEQDRQVWEYLIESHQYHQIQAQKD